MALDDLAALRRELSDLFSDRNLPAAWEEDWAFVKIDDPESAHPPAATELLAPTDNIETWLEPSDFAGQVNRPGDGSTAIPEFGVITVPDFGLSASFPGAPHPYHVGNSVPPPDCLAFYLPFHYFHPVWWGIYLIVEGVQELASFVDRQTGGVLTYPESVVVARLFLYGHEAFHHIVESFATRLEVSHRKPLYRTGFHDLYRKGAGTHDAIEESLATAHGYRKVDSRAFRKPNEPQKRRAALEAIAEYIRRCPPGYNRALEFVQTSAFTSQRSAFAEKNHNWALPDIRPRGAHVWHSFPNAFSGISRVHSRVNYAIHRHSPLIDRVRTRGH
jgi:hypothetical protein